MAKCKLYQEYIHRCLEKKTKKQQPGISACITRLLPRLWTLDLTPTLPVAQVKYWSSSQLWTAVAREKPFFERDNSAPSDLLPVWRWIYGEKSFRFCLFFSLSTPRVTYDKAVLQLPPSVEISEHAFHLFRSSLYFRQGKWLEQ